MTIIEEVTPTYASPVAQLWYEKLNFCGCGNPESVLERIRDTLRAFKARSDYWHSKPSSFGLTPDPKSKELTDTLNAAAGPDRISQLFMYYTLDAAGLEEHGGSVPGWLTEEGKKILAWMEANPDSGDWLP